MSRLIDADALIELLEEKMFNSTVMCPIIKLTDVLEIVEEQSTAYDPEAVVAELEKLKQHNKELSEGAYLEDDKSFYFCAYTNFARAIEIVRNGGV